MGKFINACRGTTKKHKDFDEVLAIQQNRMLDRRGTFDQSKIDQTGSTSDLANPLAYDDNIVS